LSSRLLVMARQPPLAPVPSVERRQPGEVNAFADTRREAAPAQDGAGHPQEATPATLTLPCYAARRPLTLWASISSRMMRTAARIWAGVCSEVMKNLKRAAFRGTAG